MKLVMTGLVALFAAAEIQETKKAGGRDPAVAAPGEGAGRGFTVEVDFSRVWESSESIRRFVRQGLRPRSGATNDLDALVTKFESSEPEKDPLHIACRIDCTTVRPESWLAVLSVAHVSFRDDARRGPGRTGRPQRGPSWRIDSKTPDRRRSAASVIEDLSLAWRFPLTTAEEHSVLESQLVAAALVLLESRPVKVRVDARRGELSFPEVDELLTSVLPEEFPLALLDRVVWFLHEALSRGVGPGSVALAPTGRFTFRGIPYEVDRSRQASATRGPIVRASVKRARSGLALRETALLESETGRTIESRGIVVYAPRVGETTRFGATRWHVRREDR